MQDQNVMSLMSKIVRIRNAADRISVSGYENRELIAYIYNSCNDILTQLDDVMSKQSEQKEESCDDANKNFS